jgi:hypothetical protein
MISVAEQFAPVAGGFHAPHGVAKTAQVKADDLGCFAVRCELENHAASGKNLLGESLESGGVPSPERLVVGAGDHAKLTRSFVVKTILDWQKLVVAATRGITTVCNVDAAVSGIAAHHELWPETKATCHAIIDRSSG